MKIFILDTGEICGETENILGNQCKWPISNKIKPKKLRQTAKETLLVWEKIDVNRHPKAIKTASLPICPGDLATALTELAFDRPEVAMPLLELVFRRGKMLILCPELPSQDGEMTLT